jgi:16S rRNA G1207 methylase RsmC
MSSSNLAVRMEHTATDMLSHPPRPLLRVVASNERPVQSVRLRTSFTNRKFVTRDQGFRLFRVR